MKRIFKSLLPLICSIALLSGCNSTPKVEEPTNDAMPLTVEREDNDKTKSTLDLHNYNKTTFNELGKPTIANTESYYEDGVIYYTTTGSTVGYSLSNTNVLVDFNLTVNKPFVWPSWFSFNLRASSFGRTHGGDIQNLGYVVMFYPSGVLSLGKDRSPATETTYPLFNIGQKYHFQIGTVDEGNGVIVIIAIDGNIVLEYHDDSNPLKDGTWFTLCGDSANGAVVNLTLESTWDVPVPKYDTYTFSTLGIYAIRAGSVIPSVDKYNNIEIFNGGQTVGFGRQLQNFSLAGNFYITEMSTLANLFICFRASNFSRYNGIENAYSFRFREDGTMFLYKIKDYQLIQIGLSGYYLEPNTNYYVEFGAVDYPDNKTLLFLNINNTPVIEAFDSDNPFQRPGIITINPEGTYNVKIGSKINSLTPLQSKVEERNDKRIVRTYLSIPFANQDTPYEDFEERVLKSVLLDEQNIKEINDTYYALDVNSNKVKAVNMYTYLNQLVVEFNKTIYKASDDSLVNYAPETLTILRSRTSSGFITPNETTLKNTYSYSL